MKCPTTKALRDALFGRYKRLFGGIQKKTKVFFGDTKIVLDIFGPIV